MTFRHFLKQILQPLPGFAGMFQRRQQLREHARMIGSLRAHAAEQDSEVASLHTRAAEQNSAIDSLRTRAAEKDGEVTSLRVHAAEQDSEVASLHTRAAEQDSALASLHARIEGQGGEIASFRDQLAAMCAEAEAREAEHAAAKHLRWKDVPHLERRGLFVVGHARSGTSILMTALNASPEICLLGEANLYVEGMRPDFVQWFNKMHKEQGQPSAKHWRIPMPDDAANGPETLEWLSKRFRYVGEKIAFRSSKYGFNLGGFFDFQAANFFMSHYICIIRNPRDVMISNREMFKPADMTIYVESYLRQLENTLALYNTLPNVVVVFHETTNEKTFEVIGERLGVDLSGVYKAYYDQPAQANGRHKKHQEGWPGADALATAYGHMRNAFSPDTLRETPHHPQWMILDRSIRKLREDFVAANTGEEPERLTPGSPLVH